MRRRAFLNLVGGLAAWPVIARAQQPERMAHIGILVNSLANESQSQARLAAFSQGLLQLGWTEGRNIRMDIRWAGPAANSESHRKAAAELVALSPDVILSTTGASTAALQRATRTIPIVFAMVLDPVGADIVESMARPGANITGFMQFEFSLAGKWLELLKSRSQRA
jgi:putative ABC transport system substrate-binding protein